MTLNIMLTERSSVYLSADFRLTYRNGQYGYYSDEPHAPKLVPVFKFGWSALVAFAGVARTDKGQHVGDWVIDQARAIGWKEPIESLIESLKQADGWLCRISGDRRLTFSVVGFIERRPLAALVSNFQDFDGNGPLQPTLTVARQKPKAPSVFLGGDDSMVTVDERHELWRVLSSTRSRPEVHQAMADLTERASTRSDTVSPSCFTGHLIPTGKAELIPHGIDETKEFLPRFVEQADRLEPTIGDDGKPLPRRLIGMTATVQSRTPGDRAVGILYAFRNVQDPSW